MNREETKKLFAYMGTLYQTFTKDVTSEKIDLWTELLCDFTYEEILASFREYARTNVTGFAPVPGQLIRPIAEKRIAEVAPDEAEAWAMVRDAIGNGIYGSKAEFKKLPPLVQRAVGSPSVIEAWAMQETETLEVVRSNFLRTYRFLRERAVTENGSTGAYPDPAKALEQRFDLGGLIEEHKETMSEEEKSELLEWWGKVKSEGEKKPNRSWERPGTENYDYLLRIPKEELEDKTE